MPWWPSNDDAQTYKTQQQKHTKHNNTATQTWQNVAEELWKSVQGLFCYLVLIPFMPLKQRPRTMNVWNTHNLGETLTLNSHVGGLLFFHSHVGETLTSPFPHWGTLILHSHAWEPLLLHSHIWEPFFLHSHVGQTLLNSHVWKCFIFSFSCWGNPYFSIPTLGNS